MSMSVSRIKMGEQQQQEEDSLSSLPDCVIDIIFKFMETRQIVQMSVLSKRWTSLWKSTSYLNFNAWSSDENHIDSVLLLRNHSYDIHKLHLAYVGCQPTKLDRWVTYAMSRNVQEVTVTGIDINKSTLVALCRKLKCLILRDATVMFEDYRCELLLSCPIMETLDLGVSSCYQADDFDDQIYCRNIKLSAPNLRVFNFKGCTSKNHTLENLSNLLIATINVDIWSDEEDDEDTYLLDNLLGGFPNIESLEFSLNDIPANLKHPITLDKVATLQNLRYLKLATYFPGEARIYCFSTILKLLEKSPNIKTLVLDARLYWEHESSEEDLVAGLMSWCKLCHLKTFKIEGVHIEVSTCAFKFLECLMENATSLQNVVMTTSNTTKEKEKLANICKQLKVPSAMTIMASDRIGVSLKPSRKVLWETA